MQSLHEQIVANHKEEESSVKLASTYNCSSLRCVHLVAPAQPRREEDSFSSTTTNILIGGGAAAADAHSEQMLRIGISQEYHFFGAKFNFFPKFAR